MDLNDGGGAGDAEVEVIVDAGEGEAGNEGEGCDFKEGAFHLGLRQWMG